MKEQYIKPCIHELRPARVGGIVYDGYYITEDGNVFSDWKPGCKKGVRGVDYLHKMTPVRDRNGYLAVTLRRDGVTNVRLVHRLVAEAFLKNPEGLPQVNHKNEDKTDNRAENLEWCTAKYNCNYGTRNKRVSEALSGRCGEKHPMYGKRHTDESRRKMSEALSGEKNPMYGRCGELCPMYGKRHTDETRRKMSEALSGKGCIPICQYSKDGVFLREWCSGTEASETLEINGGNINSCCNGRVKSAGGFVWRYKNKNI